MALLLTARCTQLLLPRVLIVRSSHDMFFQFCALDMLVVIISRVHLNVGYRDRVWQSRHTSPELDNMTPASGLAGGSLDLTRADDTVDSWPTRSNMPWLWLSCRWRTSIYFFELVSRVATSAHFFLYLRVKVTFLLWMYSVDNFSNVANIFL
jgi:hypothetical protein